MKNNNEKQSELEAVLFVYGEPLTYKKIEKFLALEPNQLKDLITGLEQKLVASPFMLISHDNSLELVTKPEFGKLVQAIIKDELTEELTPAALETLAIIAYTGPLSRAKIDYIRGVNSTFILRSLLLRGLVQRFPDPTRGNAFLYKASFDLLKHLGIPKLEDLPEFMKYHALLEKLSSASAPVQADEARSDSSQANVTEGKSVSEEFNV